MNFACQPRRTSPDPPQFCQHHAAASPLRQFLLRQFLLRPPWAAKPSRWPCETAPLPGTAHPLHRNIDRHNRPGSALPPLRRQTATVRRHPVPSTYATPARQGICHKPDARQLAAHPDDTDQAESESKVQSTLQIIPSLSRGLRKKLPSSPCKKHPCMTNFRK